MPKRIISKNNHDTYDDFVAKSLQLIKRLGTGSIDLMEIRLELSGTTENNELIKAKTISNIMKQIQAILPRQFPMHAISGSRIVALVDSLMSGFFVEKINRLIRDISRNDFRFTIKKAGMSQAHQAKTEANYNVVNNIPQCEQLINETLKQLNTPAACEDKNSACK